MRILHVEDSDSDAELVARALRRGLGDVQIQRVSDATGLRLALDHQTWDAIITDWNLPDFSGSAAHDMVRERGLDIPFIIVSAAIGEKPAVAAMRAGVHDYVMKDTLARLVPAIQRELREAGLRQERRQAQESLRVSEARFRRLAESGIIGIAIADVRGAAHETNEAYRRMVGRSHDDLLAGGVGWAGVTPSEWQASDDHAIEQLQLNGVAVPWEKEIIRDDGTRVAVLMGAAMLDHHNCIAFAADVTERKQAQQALAERARLASFSAGIGKILGAARTLKKGLQLAAETFVRDAEASATQIWLRQPGDAGLELAAQAASGPNPPAGPPSKFPLLLEDRQLGEVIVYGLHPIPHAVAETFVSTAAQIGEFIHRKLAESELRSAKVAAEAASRAKTEFLNNVSHELRTPMNIIFGMTDILLDTEISADQRSSLEIVRASSESLLALITNILDFSRIDSGVLELEPAVFSPREALNDALRLLLERSAPKGLDLTSEVDPDVPGVLVGDARRLTEILINLGGNAIKFTDNGLVRVKLISHSGSTEETELAFSIADTGIGIACEQRQAIFQAFTQADGSSTRRFEGTGLGLTLAARLVELMGGRIWCESELGQGSTFYFTARFANVLAPA